MRKLSVILIFCLAIGCKTSRQVEVLESQLRQQEEVMSQLSGELEQTRHELNASRMDANSLRTQLASSGQSSIPAEQAEMFYRISGLTIDRMQSSFLPDGQGGGEFAVLLTPVDQLQAPMRVPGDVVFRVYDKDDRARNTILFEKRVPGKDVSLKWTSGWVSSGFLLQFPWRAEEMRRVVAEHSLEDVVVETTFITADQRNYTARLTLPLSPEQRTDLESLSENVVPPPGNEPEIQSVGFDGKLAGPEEKPFSPAVPESATASETLSEPAPPTIHSDRRTLEEFPTFR